LFLLGYINSQPNNNKESCLALGYESYMTHWIKACNDKDLEGLSSLLADDIHIVDDPSDVPSNVMFIAKFDSNDMVKSHHHIRAFDR